jgi:hypothetical protein
MIKRVDHVSIAVRELFSGPAEGQGFRWTMIELGTSCLVELVDPIGEEGFLHRFLEERGEGTHHITIHVDNAGEAHAAFAAKGIPTFGYNSFPNWKEFFVHPRDAFGTLLQFVEFEPLDWINPGYVPKAYEEFRPRDNPDDSEKQTITVRPVEGGGGSAVELTDGSATMVVERADLPKLIQRLQEAAR